MNQLTRRVLSVAIVALLIGVIFAYRPQETINSQFNQATNNFELGEVAQEMQALQDSLAKLTTGIEDLKKSRPAKPRKASASDKLIFDIDVDPLDFPELAGYEELEFSLDLQRSEVKSSFFDSVWHDLKIERADGIDDYKMVITNEHERLSFFSFPIFQGKAYGKAMAFFEKKLKAYQVKFKQLTQQKQGVKQRYQRLRAKWQHKLAQIEALVEEKGRQL